MSKSTVTRLFIGSLIAATAGGIAIVIAVGVAFANGVFVMSGADVVDIHQSPLAFGLLGLGLVGALTIAGAAVGGLIAWIGALLNTAQLETKTWFLVLLLLGIFNFGVFAMIAYLIAGPDGTRTAAREPAALPAGA